MKKLAVTLIALFAFSAVSFAQENTGGAAGGTETTTEKKDVEKKSEEPAHKEGMEHKGKKMTKNIEHREMTKLLFAWNFWGLSIGRSCSTSFKIHGNFKFIRKFFVFTCFIQISLSKSY